LAIETGLMVRVVLHLPLLQTEGLQSSIFELLEVSLAVPDHSTLSRREMNLESISKVSAGPIHLLIDSTGLKVCGVGDWFREKHGAKVRRTWRKLHLISDAAIGVIAAATLTEDDRGDSSQVSPLLAMVEAEIASVTVDGAYDGAPTYEAVAAITGDIAVIIPPRASAVVSPALENVPSQRDGI
jgi:transposase